MTEKLERKGAIVRSYQKGVWSQNCQMRFNGNLEEAGAISNEGTTNISCMALDELMENCVSFIKMDIEGAEMEALKGAERLIQKWHPQLAICIYHSDKDMVEIIKYIHCKFPFYKVYVRQYTWFYADKVLYAID